ncbi:MAG: COP23 domain-containing protein [Cyanobacteria bacterium P01_C01_bin.89]
MRHLLQALLSTVVTLGLGTTLAIPTQAESPRSFSFVCQQAADGTYRTIAGTRTAEFPVFVWKSQHFSDAGWTPDRRCAEVSQRLQRLVSQGKMNYLRGSYLNNMPVICAFENRNQSICDNENLVFTLQYTADMEQSLTEYAIERIKQLQPLTNSSSIIPLQETPEDAAYFNFAGYLERLHEDAAPTPPTNDDFFGDK